MLVSEAIERKHGKKYLYLGCRSKRDSRENHAHEYVLRLRTIETRPRGATDISNEGDLVVHTSV